MPTTRLTAGSHKSVASETEFLSTRSLIITYGLALMPALVGAAIYRGPWMDEFWSLWLSGGGSPSVDVQTRWLEDVHPPLYSALFYWIFHAIKLDIRVSRLLNIVPLVLFFLATVYFSSKDRRDRNYYVLFFVATSSCPLFVKHFSEFRSYFTGLCAVAILLSALRYMCSISDDTSGRKSFAEWAILTLALIACLNIHYITALFTAITGTAFGLRLLLRGNKAFFLKIAVIGIIGALPLVAFFSIQASYLASASTSFWIKSSFSQALTTMFKVAALAIAPQIVLGFVVAKSRAYSASAKGKITDANPSKDIFSPTLMSSIVVFCLLLDRYLLPVAAAFTAVLVDLASRSIHSHRLLLPAVFLNATVLVVAAGIKAGLTPGWYESASRIENHLRACPSSQVIPVTWHAGRVKNQKQVLELGYAYVASRFGIPLSTIQDRKSSALAAQCPNIIWIEHTAAKAVSPNGTKQVLEQYFPDGSYRDAQKVSLETGSAKTSLILLAN
jgi:hypothetical protein